MSPPRSSNGCLTGCRTGGSRRSPIVIWNPRGGARRRGKALLAKAIDRACSTTSSFAPERAKLDRHRP